MDKVFVVFLVFLVTAVFMNGLYLKFKAAQLAEEKNDPAAEASYSGDLFHRISEFLAAVFIVAFLIGLL